MTTFKKQRTGNNIELNFNQSHEIGYWSKKLNISSIKFKKVFKETNSIAKTIASFQRV